MRDTAVFARGMVWDVVDGELGSVRNDQAAQWLAAKNSVGVWLVSGADGLGGRSRAGESADLIGVVDDGGAVEAGGGIRGGG